MLHKMFSDEMPRTYATYANAEKALHRAVGKAGDTLEHIHYLIAATPAGRFYPVLLPSDEQVQFAIYLAHDGIAFART